MDTKEKADRLFLPVRRKLAAVAVAALSGALLAAVCVPPVAVTGGVCVCALAWMLYRRVRRESVLLGALCLMFALGNGMAGARLAQRDLPTQTGVCISGVVSAIERPYRVILRDVAVEDRGRLSHGVTVTLMCDAQEAPEVFVGQTVSGTGRLFAPEEQRNPGGVDRRIQALCEGTELSGYLLPGWQAGGARVFSLREMFRSMRECLLMEIERLFGDQAPLFQGLLLGERRNMDDALVASMRLTGTVHLLTVSGLHLSAIAELLRCLLRRAHRRLRFCSLIGFLAAFTALTGCAPGTVRAMIMAILREWAALRGRQYDPLTALAAAALAMTLCNPLWVFSASFQFSFFVVLGILLLAGGPGRRFSGRVPGALRGVLGAALVTASAQLAALPMQLLFYGYVPLLALPMNLLCGMLTPVMLVSGWAAVLAGAICPPLGMAAARLLSACSAAFERLSLSAAAVDGALLRLPAPAAWCVVLFACLMALLSRRICWGNRRWKAAGAVALTLAAAYACRFCPAARYVQLDVGQGDAALLRTGRRAVIVDVGPEYSYELLRYLRHEGLYVDAVVLSHLDADHAGALGVLLDSEVETPMVVLPEDAAPEEASPAVQEALAGLARDGVQVCTAARGDRLVLGRVTMDVLSPDASLHGSNERSLLLYACVQGVRFLLAGDLPAHAEPETVPACDVLKVAHHGSRQATSDAFLGKAVPRLAVISVGADNRYGHPGERVLEALRAVGSRVLRTDESGCITLWLGGDKPRVSCFLSR